MIKSRLRLYNSTRRIGGFDFHVENTAQEGDRVTVTVPIGMNLPDIIHTLRFITYLIEQDMPREARRLKQRNARIKRAALAAQIKEAEKASTDDPSTSES